MTEKIRKELLALQDMEYRDFHAKLMPTVKKEKVIGIRVPVLRQYAKKIENSKNISSFLNDLPHKFYEENNLHGILISEEKEFDKCIDMLNRFLPFVDNWATCDIIRPVCFKNNTEKLEKEIDSWLLSEDTFTVRFGIEMLMVWFLDDNFSIKYPQKVSEITSGEYYVNMMIAWYFATALCKQWDSVIKYLEENRLPLWVHNKTIQKAAESFRITDEKKNYLKTLKRKNN